MHRTQRPNVMRVQLQQGSVHYADDVAEWPADQGVSVQQLEQSLVILFNQGRPRIPTRLESVFLGAIARTGIWARETRAAGGIARTGTVHQEYFGDRHAARYRLDTENLRGHNLRR